MKSVRVSAWIVCVALIHVFAAKTALAGEPSHYSGKYSAVAAKPTVTADSTLEIVQSDANIEITRLELGRRTTSRCPLDGSEGEYTSPGGVVGKCKAYLKGKYLVIESLVVTHPQPTASVRIHTRERWQLSADSKTLTIKSDADFPDFPASISGAVAGDTSATRKYTRTDTP